MLFYVFTKWLALHFYCLVFFLIYNTFLVNSLSVLCSSLYFIDPFYSRYAKSYLFWDVNLVTCWTSSFLVLILLWSYFIVPCSSQSSIQTLPFHIFYPPCSFFFGFFNLRKRFITEIFIDFTPLIGIDRLLMFLIFHDEQIDPT